MTPQHADQKPGLPVVLLSAAALALGLYVGGYGVARITHRLVNCGSYIAAAHASSRLGVGSSSLELAFLPLMLLESGVRSALSK